MQNTSPKLTKKQRKHNWFPNEAVKRSIKEGKQLSPIYWGALPEFQITYPNGYLAPVKVVQTKKGVPFINLTLRKNFV